MTSQDTTLDGDHALVEKTAAGVTVYLMEELGDARMRCDQLLRYVEKASQLIEKSKHKDHFFEVAGDIIRGIPESAFKLHKALQAVALAAGRLDYEEIKQDLKPEKVEELERVLKDVRVRHVQRRSLPMLNPQGVSTQLQNLAKRARAEGRLATTDLAALIQDLEAGASKTAESEGEHIASQLEAMSHALENPPEGEVPSRVRLAQILRRTLAAHIDLTDADAWSSRTAVKVPEGTASELAAVAASVKKLAKGSGDPKRLMIGILSGLALAVKGMGQDEMISNLLDRAASAVQSKWSSSDLKETVKSEGADKTATGDDRRSRYEEGESADPTENMNDADAKAWKSNTEEHKDKFKKNASSEEQWEMAHEIIEQGDNHPAFKAIKKAWGQVDEALNRAKQSSERMKRVGAGRTEDPTFVTSWVTPAMKDYAEEVMTIASQMNQRLGAARLASSEEDKRSRYEEGKSADPTENMSDADAKEWKSNTEEHKDKFKKEARVPSADKLFARMKEAVEGLLAARVRIRVVWDDLGEVRRDATGLVFTNNYENEHVKAVEKELYDLDHTIGMAFRNVEHLEREMKKTMLVGKRASGEDDRRSRYEEGKPADPTKNMSDADAKAWKENTEEHKDKFKSGHSTSDAEDWKAA